MARKILSYLDRIGLTEDCNIYLFNVFFCFFFNLMMSVTVMLKKSGGSEEHQSHLIRMSECASLASRD